MSLIVEKLLAGALFFVVGSIAALPTSIATSKWPLRLTRLSVLP